MYYEGLEILKIKKPKYSIIENVKNLIGKKFKEQFEQMLRDLDKMGYNNYCDVLNAKDFGVPQNRERVFIVSIRKDIEDGKFEFPKGFDNGVRLKDLLEENVDNRYYIKQAKIDANYYRGLDNHASHTGIMQIGMLNIKGNEQVRRVYSPEGISPTLSTMQGGNRQPKVLENNVPYGYRIRKLTPLECFRLMGFDDDDYYILKENKISNTQMYKMAGNSIVVDVLEYIFKNLFKH